MRTVRAEPVDSPDAVVLLRGYFAELTVRYFHRDTTEREIEQTLQEFPSTGLVLFLILRNGGLPAGCLGLLPSGELTRIYIAPQFRRAGGASTLLRTAAALTDRQQRSAAPASPGRSLVAHRPCRRMRSRATPKLPTHACTRPRVLIGVSAYVWKW